MVTAVCLVGAALLGGCDRSASSDDADATNGATAEGRIGSGRARGTVRVWRDPETGCQYLVWQRGGRGSMTPRVKPDGLPICG